VLKIARPQKVNVMGDVRVPAVVEMKVGWRLTECLSACGGLASGITAADVTVTVLHADTRKRNKLALNDVLQGDESNNLAVSPGDVVSFDAVETFPVYVVGHVKLPGVYRVRKDRAGVMEAITLAGGLDDLAGTGNVALTHVNGESTKLDLSPAILRGEKLTLPPVQSGDLIVVPEAQGKVAVLGLVKAPGFYPLPDGKTVTLSDCIAQAQGSDARRARLGKVALVRTENGVQKRYLYDLGKFLAKGDATQNPKVLAGDLVYVPETNTPDWTSVFSSLSTMAVFYSASRR
jgi:protein involved in polysaccharide export with SLBB domain